MRYLVRQTVASAPGTGPPYMPLCTAWSSVRTSTTRFAMPRSGVAIAGWPIRQFEQSASTTASAPWSALVQTR